MTGEELVVTGGALAAVSGIPAVCLSPRSAAGQWIAAALLVAGCGVSLYGAYEFVASGSHESPLSLPAPYIGAHFTIALDAISLVFLLPVCIVPLLGTIYGLSYWKQAEHPENGRKLRLFYGFLAGSLMFVVTAKSGFLFLFAWEIMALSAFFLVATDDHDGETRDAGWLYLASSHFATLCLFVLFGLIFVVSHQFGFGGLRSASPGMATAIFLVALIGFGTKAGLMPLHFWLPSAHAMAPSHVSALMSGVLIKAGVYGIVRVTAELPSPPAWWGGLLLGLGIASGILGLAFALAQHDLKRLLAYSSVENIGIIAMGIGLALLGRSFERSEWIVLGLGGALMHVWNHSLFKSLLFLNAGAVIHATHTRQMNRLGGLAKKMPLASACFLVGGVAACGLPPLNGFVSEIMLYLGFFKTLGSGAEPGFPLASMAAPALALIGALSGACFVNALGTVYLGAPRTEQGSHAHEPDGFILAPMLALALGCVIVGAVPWLVMPLLDRAIADWWIAAGGATSPQSLALALPLAKLTTAALVLWGLVGAYWLWLQWRLSANEVGFTETWGCGYAGPTARMQYTASSFSEVLRKLFGWVLLPIVRWLRVDALFPRASGYGTHTPDTILQRGVVPAFEWIARLFSGFRIMQQGNLHVYLFYIFVILVALLAWAMNRQ